jgi:phage antirepressor YoqD-like protein
MESSYKFKGQKFERNLSFHEAAKILGTSNVKLLELLRKKEILFKINNRNLPYDKFLNRQWFEVSSSEVTNSGFSGVVPIVRITKKGFDEIEKLLLEDDTFIKYHNQRTFFKTITIKITEKLKDLNIDFKDIKDWLSKNTVSHNDKDIVTIFTFIDSKKVDLICYDLKKKIIIENERK